MCGANSICVVPSGATLRMDVCYTRLEPLTSRGLPCTVCYSHARALPWTAGARHARVGGNHAGWRGSSCTSQGRGQPPEGRARPPGGGHRTSRAHRDRLVKCPRPRSPRGRESGKRVISGHLRLSSAIIQPRAWKDGALRNPYRVNQRARRPRGAGPQLQPHRRASIPTSARSCGLYSSSSAMVEGTVGCLSRLLSC